MGPEAKALQKAPAEWVEGLVQQMSGARDLGDARLRAANELRSFEQAVMHSTNKVSDRTIIDPLAIAILRALCLHAMQDANPYTGRSLTKPAWHPEAITVSAQIYFNL